MKRSQTFWAAASALALVGYNVAWFLYEMRHWNEPDKMTNLTYTCAVGLVGFMIDLMVVLWLAWVYIPIFNMWLDGTASNVPKDMQQIPSSLMNKYYTDLDGVRRCAACGTELDKSLKTHTATGSKAII